MHSRTVDGIHPLDYITDLIGRGNASCLQKRGHRGGPGGFVLPQPAHGDPDRQLLPVYYPGTFQGKAHVLCMLETKTI